MSLDELISSKRIELNNLLQNKTNEAVNFIMSEWVA